MSIVDTIQTIAVARGKTTIFGMFAGDRGANIVLMDNGDENGQHISYWGTDLGPPPVVSDGFTDQQLHLITRLAALEAK